MSYEVERVIKIWNEHGDRVEIGPDRDGLDMVEVQIVDRSGTENSISFESPELALMVANAIIELYKGKV